MSSDLYFWGKKLLFFKCILRLQVFLMPFHAIVFMTEDSLYVNDLCRPFLQNNNNNNSKIGFRNWNCIHIYHNLVRAQCLFKYPTVVSLSFLFNHRQPCKCSYKSVYTTQISNWLANGNFYSVSMGYCVMWFDIKYRQRWLVASSSVHLCASLNHLVIYSLISP